MKEKDLDDYLDLFMHPGWKAYIAQAQEAFDTLRNTAHLVENERQLYRRKGEIQKLAELLAFEEVVKLQAAEEAVEAVNE